MDLVSFLSMSYFLLAGFSCILDIVYILTVDLDHLLNLLFVAVQILKLDVRVKDFYLVIMGNPY